MGLELVCAVFLVFFVVSSEAAAVNDLEGNNLGRGLDAKSVLTSLAGNFLTRGYGATGVGTSQVISFNLTNLLVLVLLKALIFAAGSIGAGHLKGGYARSADGEEKLITDEEVLMFLSYLAGSPGCLQNIACMQPEQAKKYVNAADILFRFSQMFSIHTDLNYEEIIHQMDQAANIGLAGGSCSNFECSTKY